jgi:hypothetical protein
MTENVLGGIEIIAPPKRRINLNGEIIEVSFIKSKITLEALRIQGEVEKGTLGEYDGTNQLIDLALEICTSNPNITKDWFLENTSMEMVMALFEAAGNNKNKQVTQSGEPAKN